jgi:guanine nucleotide-binding protein G(i) subunit alpha
MGCCSGGGDGAGAEDLDPDEKRRNELLARAANKKEEEQKQIIKMLLLGAGESGKSTIFKQMKVNFGPSYSEKERKEYVGIVYGNVILSMKAMMEAFEKLGCVMPDDLAKLNDTFSESSQSEKLTPALGEVLKAMWSHEATQGIFAKRNEYQLTDSTRYYFEAIDRLCATDYLPTVDDVLRSRVRTTGIVQSDFNIKTIQFSLFDVGGQRNERRKWIHCFDNVQAVVFVASASEFDQKLYEDETQVPSPLPSTHATERQHVDRHAIGSPPSALTHLI